MPEYIVLKKLFEPSDIAILVYFRIVFGAIMLWEVYRYFVNKLIFKYWIDPVFNFTYYGFDWLKPLPGDGMYYLFLVIGILSIFIMVGFKYRISTILFFFAFTYMFLIDQTRYLNHFYLISLVSFVLIFIPAHKAFSIDSWWNKKLRTDFVPAWSLWLLRFQISIPYFFGGIAKINEDWLNGKPLDMWLPRLAPKFPILGELFTETWFVYFFSYSALLMDLLAVPFLLWKRSRIFVFGLLTTFHILNSQLFPLGIFPWFMIFATLMFFDPSWPRIIINKFKITEESQAKIRKNLQPENPKKARRALRQAKTVVKKLEPKITSLTKNQKIVLSLFLIFIIFQIVMPLRHFAYPGNVSWTEEGQNFSWHMMLDDKINDVEYFAFSPKSGETWRINPSDFLTDKQLYEMSGLPDMILQYGHFLAEIYRENGYDDIEIRVDVFSSLNGRDAQRLIDPHVNLAEQPVTILPKSWIVPLD